MANSCPGCGSSLNAGARFCGDCGRPVSSVSAAPVTSVSAATRNAAPAASSRVLFVVPDALSTSADGPMLVDDLRRLTSVPVLVVSGRDALGSVQSRVSALAATGLDAVCLVGSDRVLPMARVDDPTGMGDSVLTDNFFGRPDTPDEATRLAGDLLPDVPVSRLPFDDVASLRTLVGRSGPLCASWEGGVSVSTAVWSGASHAVAEVIGARARPLLSPPTEVDAVGPHLEARPGRLYFNVHGSDQETSWVGDGEGRHPVVLTPESVGIADRGVVVSEACFGAAVFDGETGIAEAFLKAGAGAFVGSTIIAWGPPQAPPGLADLVVTGFYTALDAGETASAGLLSAKSTIRDQYLDRDDGLSPQAHNTLLSFVHYGLPTLTAGAAPTRPPVTPTRPVGSSSSVLDRVRAGMGSGGSGVLGAARQRLQGRMGGRDWQRLSAGRVALSDLSTAFRNATEVLAALGTRDLSTEAHLTRYRTPKSERVVVTVKQTTRRGLQARGVLADPDGKVLETFVTRGFGRR